MKNLKYGSLFVALFAIVTTVLTSCSSDDEKLPAKPVITLTEVGHDNSGHAHPGHDLHLEAELLAEGIIKSINVEIHQEGGSPLVSVAYTDGKYIGVRNTEFHEHIDIPATAALGEYHLHFTVTDQKGQQTTVTSELHLEEDNGEEEHEHEHEHE